MLGVDDLQAWGASRQKAYCFKLFGGRNISVSTSSVLASCSWTCAAGCSDAAEKEQWTKVTMCPCSNRRIIEGIESPKTDTDAECHKNRSPSDATLPGETPAWTLNWPPRSLTGLSLAVCWSAQCGRQWLFAAWPLLWYSLRNPSCRSEFQSPDVAATVSCAGF